MDVKGRKLGCILASVVGDAAAQPLQWIYDVNKLNALLGDAEEIEFWSPSANPFYRIDTGKQSCYGDQAHAILKSLVRKKEFNLDDQKQSTYEMFGPGTEYALIDEALKKGYPVKAAWRNGCIRYFLKKMEEKSINTGSPDDTQIDGVTKIPPIVAMFAGHPDLLFRIEDSIRMAQDNDLSVAMGLAAARIIERCLLTTNTSESMLDVVKYVMKCLSANDRTNPQELDKTVVDYLQQVIDCKDSPHSEVVPKRFVTSCDLPKALLASVHGLITASNYVEGMRTTIRVGGNHVGRCAFIGACFGAMYGDSIIPKTWQRKTLKYSDFLELSTKLVNDL